MIPNQVYINSNGSCYPLSVIVLVTWWQGNRCPKSLYSNNPPCRNNAYSKYHRSILSQTNPINQYNCNRIFNLNNSLSTVLVICYHYKKAWLLSNHISNLNNSLSQVLVICYLYSNARLLSNHMSNFNSSLGGVLLICYPHNT